MRILLINPPRHNEILADNPAFIDEERGFNPPLGLLYLAGYLKSRSEHQIFGLDAQAEGLDYNDEFKQRIKNANPALVGITAMTFTLLDVIKTIALVREVGKVLNKKISIVLGGPHVHLFPEETINLKGVDFVIKGEGEIPFYKLVESLEGRGELSNIDSLVYLSQGKIINNPVGELLENLDDLSFPDRE
ncbi:MAG: hypothetical protein COV84_01160, partial [Candidatus Portnoybacteria bacterium CG11_big_fil_rev_8_21_14_0_20_40_15]